MNVLPPDVKQNIRTKWHPLHSAEYIWTKTALPNVLLASLGDRTEMAHSIEARPPFLDHHLSEYINGLPPSVKLAYTPETALKDVAQSSANEDSDAGAVKPWWVNSQAARMAFTEKWILKGGGEALSSHRKCTNAKKHMYAAPTRWAKDRPIHNMFRKLLTRDAVEELGFVEFGSVEEALEQGFGDNANPAAFRKLVAVGCCVAIAQKFKVKGGEDGLDGRLIL